MNKNRGFLILAGLLIMALILIGCSSPSPTPTSSPTSTPTPTTQPTQTTPTKTTTPAPTVAPIEFRYATSTPVSTTSPLDVWAWAAEELLKRTEGRVTFTMYFGTIAKATQEIEAVKSGLCDMADYALPMYAQVQPLTVAFDMPSVDFPDTVQGLKDRNAALNQVYMEFPELQEYWKEFQFLDLDGLPSYHLAAKKLIKVPDDAKGIKWAATGQRGKLISSIGGAAVPVASPNVYQALQTGQVDAAVLGFSGAKIFRALEITKYYTNISMGGLSRVEFMSKEAFNKMTPGDQKILMDLIPEILERGAVSGQASSDAGRAEILKLGQTIYDPTEEELALWEEVKIAAEESWLEEMEKAGQGDVATKLLNRMRELSAQSRAKASSK